MVCLPILLRGHGSKAKLSVSTKTIFENFQVIDTLINKIYICSFYFQQANRLQHYNTEIERQWTCIIYFSMLIPYMYFPQQL
jgi:hypothetical protein